MERQQGREKSRRSKAQNEISPEEILLPFFVLAIRRYHLSSCVAWGEQLSGFDDGGSEGLKITRSCGKNLAAAKILTYRCSMLLCGRESRHDTQLLFSRVCFTRKNERNCFDCGDGRRSRDGS
jgi:hypothetical protein